MNVCMMRIYNFNKTVSQATRDAAVITNIRKNLLHS